MTSPRPLLLAWLIRALLTACGGKPAPILANLQSGYERATVRVQAGLRSGYERASVPATSIRPRERKP